MLRAAATAVALLLAAAAALAGDPPKVVTFKTADGMTLEADWYPGAEGMPGIVGLHQYPSDRSSWKPLAERRPEGWHFLAVDLRGYGGSRKQAGKDLSDAVKKRDPLLFRAMWQDAVGGVAFLRTEGKCDPKRIGLVGASVGCSIALDATVRRGADIAAVAALTPGRDYLGIPSMDHVRSWQERPLLLLSTAEEADGGARPLADALKGRPDVTLRIVPGEKIHGTDMFGKVPEMEARLMAWLEAVLGRSFPDGVADPVEKAVLPGRGEAKASESGPIRNLVVRADALGLSILAEGVSLPAFAAFADPAGGADGFADGGVRVRGMASGSAALLGGCRDTWRGEQWHEAPLGNRPGTAFSGEGILEVRIPWAMLSFDPAGGKVRAGFTVIDRRPDWRAAPATWKDALGTVMEVPRWDPAAK